MGPLGCQNDGFLLVLIAWFGLPHGPGKFPGNDLQTLYLPIFCVRLLGQFAFHNSGNRVSNCLFRELVVIDPFRYTNKLVHHPFVNCLPIP